jgi:hypothetical protein
LIRLAEILAYVKNSSRGLADVNRGMQWLLMFDRVLVDGKQVLAYGN